MLICHTAIPTPLYWVSNVLLLPAVLLLSGYSGAEDLGPKESTFCSFDNLLVDGAGRVVHHHCAFLVVDLGIDSSITDEVDNPLLTLILA